MILRDYQSALIDQTRESLRSGKRSPLLVSPCGSGKTVMFSYFAKEIASRGKRTLILAHREELLDQISATLTEFKAEHGFIAAGRLFMPRHLTQVASVFSLVRRLSKVPAPDIIIIDEAHHAVLGSTWGKILKYYAQARRIGVTATPYRLSGEPLSDIFDDLILGPSVSDLIRFQKLSKYKIFVPSTIQTEGVKSRGGDYARKELSFAADKPTITGDCIKHYKKHADGKRAIVFCVGVEHAKHVAEEFNAAGYPSVSIDGGLGHEIRSTIIREFREGKIKVLTNCDLISEGFDLPAIECAIMLRPTQSLGLWIQQSGRALRPYPGKECAIILDHSGNTLRHGFPDDDREWSLEGRSHKRRADNSSHLRVRVCSSCLGAQAVGQTKCNFCGYEFEVKPREILEIDGELTEVDPTEVRANRLKEQREAKTLEELKEIERARGYKPGWAAHYHRHRNRWKRG